ncbi:MFS general substrate transporter [Thozetella sp. PMI_491]|nr:MFS general substrate transporter [Thozetella sp. PMI_491]
MSNAACNLGSPVQDPVFSDVESDQTLAAADGPPNEGGYGWVCVFAMLLITANTWGVNGAFGVYLAQYLSANTFPGTSQITYAFIGGLSISQITFIAPLVTFVSKHCGTHITLAIGVILETAALVCSSFATEVWHLFLTQGAIFGWGCGFLYVGSVGIVPQWFSRRASLATASLGSEAMIHNTSLPWSFRITAIVTCAMNTICTVLMRDRNKTIRPDQKAFDFNLLRRYPFLCIVGWAYCSTLGYTLILFSLPDNAVAIGLSARQGALAGALANLGMAFGRPVVGYFSDSVGRINMITAATFVCSLYCFCIWTSANTSTTLFAFSFLGGSVCGTYYAMVAPLLTEIFGIRSLPSALSIVWTIIVLPTAFAEPIGLALVRAAGGRYLPVQLFTGLVFLLATGCMLLLRVWAVRHIADLDIPSKKYREKAEEVGQGVRQVSGPAFSGIPRWHFERI